MLKPTKTALPKPAMNGKGFFVMILNNGHGWQNYQENPLKRDVSKLESLKKVRLKKIKQWLIGLLVLSTSLLLISCDSSNTPIEELARFSIGVTDAPTDNAAAVVIEFTALELKPANGPPITYPLDSPRSIDLLNFQGSNSAQLFSGLVIPPGEYQWLRLKVNAEQQVLDSYIEFTGGEIFSLFIPSGGTRGLQWNQGFVAPANGSVDFTLDLDVKQSIHPRGNASDDFILRPVIRVVDNLQIGHISGIVEAALLNDPSCGESVSVYLFSIDQAVDDIGSASGPETTALVKMNLQGDWSYTLGFLLPGNYQVALTCQSANDFPDQDDDINFLATQLITVTAGETRELNF